MRYFSKTTTPCKAQAFSCPLSIRERVGVRDSRCPIIAGVPPPSLLPKGGGTKPVVLTPSPLRGGLGWGVDITLYSENPPLSLALSSRRGDKTKDIYLKKTIV